MKKLLKTKIIPFFLSNRGCPFRCVYCNQFFQTGETASLKKQLDVFEEKVYRYLDTISGKHKIEIAFYGGTFTGLKEKEQRAFLSKAKRFLDKGIINSIRISTHPLFIDERKLSLLKEYEVKTVELGVQSFNNKVLFFSKRGYTRQTVFDAINLVKNFNFKLGIQLMAGLPMQSEKISYIDSIYSAKFNPDFIRIYPCIVFKNTKLYDYFKKNIYSPWNVKKSIMLVKKMLLYFYVRKINVIRVGIHPVSDVSIIAAGPYHFSFRLLCESALRYDLLKLVVKKFNVKNAEKINLYCSKKEADYFRGIKNHNIYKFMRKGYNLTINEKKPFEENYVEIDKKKYNLPYKDLNKIYKKLVFNE